MYDSWIWFVTVAYQPTPYQHHSLRMVLSQPTIHLTSTYLIYTQTALYCGVHTSMIPYVIMTTYTFGILRHLCPRLSLSGKSELVQCGHRTISNFFPVKQRRAAQ